MKFINGWSENRDVCLLFRNEDGKKCIRRVDDFDWYFLIDKKDFKESLFEKIKIKVPELQWKEEGDYVKVFYPREVVQTTFVKSRGGEFETSVYNQDVDKLKRYYPSDYKLLKILKCLDENEIKHYEADLSLLRRYVSDNDIEFEDDLRELYIDLETDTRGFGFDKVEEHRIIMGQFYDTKNDAYFVKLAKENSDNAEREWLLKFKKLLEFYDVLYGWNSKNYDFKVLQARCKKYRIDIDWRLVRLIDHMIVFKRMTYSARGEASEKQSFALDNVAKEVIGIGKENVLEGKLPAYWFEHDRERLKKYGITDVKRMVQIEDKTQFLSINNTLCRIGNCFVNDYGVLDKVDGFMLKVGSEKGLHFVTKRKRKKSVYEGAFVLDVVAGLHKGVAVFDFVSLYPSVIRSFNMSPETKGNGELIAKNGVRFDDNVKGIVSWIFDEFVDKNRKIYKEKMKQVKPDSKEFNYYFQQEYAIKSFGLSFYGAFGNNLSRFYDQEIAEAVTKTSKYLLKRLIEFLGKDYKVVAGDTDSVFVVVRFNECDKLINECSNFIDVLMKDEFGIGDHYIKLEFEKYFKRVFFLAKKRYAGLVSWHEGQEIEFIDVRGLEYVRSDSVKSARDAQKVLMKLILEEEAVEKDLIDYLFDLRDHVVSRKLKLNDLIISQSLTKPVNQYKSDTIHSKIAKQMIKDGREVFVGTKIQYVVTNSDNGLTGCSYLDYDGNYDSDYYWNNRIYPCLERILEVVYKDFDWSKFYYESNLKNCTRCRLCLIRTNVVQPRGSKSSGVLFIGEAPGKDEDREGYSFVGRAGKELDKWIKYLKLKDYMIDNLIRCRPSSKNRDPLQCEIDQCRVHFRNLLRDVNPSILIAVGKFARKELLGISLDDSILSQSGKMFSTSKGNPVGVLVHPSYVLRNSGYDIKSDLDDLKKGISPYVRQFSLV